MKFSLSKFKAMTTWIRCTLLNQSMFMLLMWQILCQTLSPLLFALCKYENTIFVLNSSFSFGFFLRLFICLSVCAFISRCYASRKVLLTQYLWNMWTSDRKTEFLRMLAEAQKGSTHTERQTHTHTKTDTHTRLHIRRHLRCCFFVLLLLPSSISCWHFTPFVLDAKHFCGKVLQFSSLPLSNVNTQLLAPNR